MAGRDASPDLSKMIAGHVPYLRRYARALTGNQASGDAYAVATLDTILADTGVFASSASERVALFRAFHSIWSSSGAPVDGGLGGLSETAERRLAGLSPNTREALLLHNVEGFSTQDVADIMALDPDEAKALIERASQDMQDAVAGAVLIIEDEAIIALDLEALVSDMGHRVTGVARTRDGANTLGKADPPDLILADIHLADGSSGIDAVNDLLAVTPECPVIFITAYPERLLTGEKPEPAFLISKPYTEDQIRTTIAQAMLFSSAQDAMPG